MGIVGFCGGGGGAAERLRPEQAERHAGGVLWRGATGRDDVKARPCYVVGGRVVVVGIGCGAPA